MEPIELYLGFDDRFCSYLDRDPKELGNHYRSFLERNADQITKIHLLDLSPR